MSKTENITTLPKPKAVSYLKRAAIASGVVALLGYGYVKVTEKKGDAPDEA